MKNNLTFKRSDGTSIEFGSKTYVWCGPWAQYQVAVPTLHILVCCDYQNTENKTYWHLQAVISDVNMDEEMKFPNSFVWDQPKGVSLRIYDPPDEFSTDKKESNGGIVFEKLKCGVLGEVQFTINAVIGSEFVDGDSLMVSGTFDAPTIEPPVFK